MVENINNKVDRAIMKIKNIPEDARERLKDIGLDLAEFLAKRGIPVTAGTLAGMLVTAGTGNPALGFAASVSTGYAAQMAANKLAEKEDLWFFRQWTLWCRWTLCARQRHGD